MKKIFTLLLVALLVSPILNAGSRKVERPQPSLLKKCLYVAVGTGAFCSACYWGQPTLGAITQAGLSKSVVFIARLVIDAGTITACICGYNAEDNIGKNSDSENA